MAECIKKQSTKPWYPLEHVKRCAHEVVLGGPPGGGGGGGGVSWLSQSLVKLCTHEVVWSVHGSPVWKQYQQLGRAYFPRNSRPVARGFFGGGYM